MHGSVRLGGFVLILQASGNTGMPSPGQCFGGQASSVRYTQKWCAGGYSSDREIALSAPVPKCCFGLALSYARHPVASSVLIGETVACLLMLRNNLIGNAVKCQSEAYIPGSRRSPLLASEGVGWRKAIGVPGKLARYKSCSP